MPHPISGPQCLTPAASTELRAREQAGDWTLKEGGEGGFWALRMPDAALDVLETTKVRKTKIKIKTRTRTSRRIETGKGEAIEDEMRDGRREEGDSQTPIAQLRGGDRRRRRSRGRQGDREGEKQTIPLPSPPRRERKIISMAGPPSTSLHPRSQNPRTTAPPTTTSTSTTSPEKSVNKPTAKASTTPTPRKISRKTAHSLIERRRRGKMNDEFEVLREMVPACAESGARTPQREMHKLEILRASVEYIRYLRGCVGGLGGRGLAREDREGEMDGDVDGDVDMDMDMDTDLEKQDDHTTPHQKASKAQASMIDPALTSPPSPPPIGHAPPTPKLSPAILPHSQTRHFSTSTSTSPYAISDSQTPAYARIENHTPPRRTLGSGSGSGSSTTTTAALDVPVPIFVPHKHTNATSTSTSLSLSPYHLTSNNPDRRFSTSTSTSFTPPSPSTSTTHSPPGPPLTNFSAISWPQQTTSPTSPTSTTLRELQDTVDTTVDTTAAADATVALLMLNGEWPSRGRMGSREEVFLGFSGSGIGSGGKGSGGRGGEMERGVHAKEGVEKSPTAGVRKRGLSVQDLLSS